MRPGHLPSVPTLIYRKGKEAAGSLADSLPETGLTDAGLEDRHVAWSRRGCMQLGTGEPLIERAGGRFDARFSGVPMAGLFLPLSR